MRRIYLLLLTCILFATVANAQIPVTVTNPANTTPNLQPTYTSLAAALTDLNLVTAMSGPVVLTCTGVNSETAPPTGLVIGSSTLNPVLSATNTVTINTTGGAVTLNAGVGTATPGSVAPDGILAIVGADYITIDGLTLTDGNAANPATMEFGIGLFKLSATDGAQNNTIKNCIITLNRINNAAGTSPAMDGSVGIQGYNSTPAAATTVLTIAAASGTNSSNKFYTNTIQNCNIGIGLSGFASATFGDSGNDIGGAAAGTGNNILNFGGAAAAANPAAGVRVREQIGGCNISFNIINSNNGSGVDHPSTLRGIFAQTGTSASATINNNTVTIKGGGTTSALEAIDNGIGATAAGNTVSINNNTITGCTYTTATSGTFTGIVNTASAATVNINGNQLTSNATNATSGTTNMIQSTGAATVAVNINGNNINGWTFNAATSGTFNGINNSGGTATTAISISTNNFQSITHAVAGTNAHAYITNAGSCLTRIYSTNTFTNLSVNTTGSITFFTDATSLLSTGSETMSSNSIVTGFTKGGIGGTVTIRNTNASSVTGSTMTWNLNNFSNITLSGATAFNGLINTDGGAPTKTITNNTINNLTISGGTSGAILCMSVNFVGGTTTSVSNNTITNITGQGAITGILSSTTGSATTYNMSGNIVTNLTSNGTGGTVIGISFSNPSTTGNVTTNTINTLSSTGASSTVSGLIIGGGTTVNVSGNTINTISGSGATSPVANGISVTSGTTVNVFKNKIYDISQSGAISTTSPAINGMLLSGGTTVTAYNNIIGGLTAPSASLTDAIRGISVTSSTSSSTYNVYFNTVRIPATSIGANFGTSGIFHTTSTTATTATLNLRNNIIVNTSTPNGTGLAVAYRRSSGAASTLANYAGTSNNNLFYAGTPGVSNLIYSDGTSTAQTLAAYKGGVFTAGTIAPRDAASVTENPPFLSTTGSSPSFLHIDPSVATQVESGAAAIGSITDDFDGDTRNVSTPDIGADEGTFILSDISGPSITYTPVPNTCSTSPVTLNATISDASGVPTAGAGLPVLYWKINAGAYTSATATFISGNTYQFTFGSGATGGDVISYYIVAQDNAGTPNVSISPATGASGTSINPPAVSTPPTPPSSYSIFTTLAAGTYSIGAGSIGGEVGHYATLTLAVADYNTKCLGGNIIFALTDATYPTETFPIAILVNPAADATHTLTIKPNTGVAATITGGSSSVAIFKLLNAKYIAIDGVNSGGSSLTLTNANTTTASAGVWLASTATTGPGNNNIAIKNLTINGGSNTVTTDFGIVAGVDGAAPSTTGGLDNDNVTIQGNTILKSYYGIYANGTAASSAGGLDNLNINTNIIGPVATGANNIGFVGINIGNAVTPSVTLNTVQNVTAGIASSAGINTASSVAGGTISQNTIQNFSSLFAPIYGILVGGAASGSFTVSGNTISNITSTPATAGTASSYMVGIEVTSTVPATLDKNNISGIINNYTGTYGAYGINLSGGNNHVIKNNFISNITGDMTGGAAFSTTFGIFGIRIGAGTGHQVYHNSVNLYGARPGTAASSLLGAAFCLVSTSSTGCDVRNNIFSNTMTGGTTSIAYASLYLPTGGTSAMNLILNNNAYYTGTTAGVHGVCHAGTTYTSPVTAIGVGLYTAANFVPAATTPVTNLRNYTSTLLTAITTNDNAAYGFTTAAPFTSTTDLHIPAATAGQLESGGASVGITVDIDGQVRPGPAGSVNGGATAPDMGADEFDGVPAQNMTYVSSTTTQANVSPVVSNSTNQEVIGIQIVTTGTLSPISATSFTLSTTGTTTPLTNIANAKLWYTGTTGTFATTTAFGVPTAAPNGAFIITGTQALATGTNYFWLTYDVPCTATGGAFIDGECNSLTVVSAQTPTVQVPVGNRTIVVGAISGTKTVGTGGDYPTLTAAAAAVNTGGLSGDATLSILNNLTEAGMVTFNQWAECGAGGYSLTISPAATVNATISASSTSAVIKINGADKLIIDGSNNGTSSKNLTITNTNTGTSSAVVWVASASATDGANSVTVKNSIITGNASTTTLAAVFGGGTATIGTSGVALTNNSKLTISNNTISKAQTGILVLGVSTASLNTSLAIKDNTLGSAVSGDGFLQEGIDIRTQSGAIVSGNDVQNVNGNSPSNMSGINIIDCQGSTISENKVHNIRYTGTSTLKIFALTTSTSVFNTITSQSANVYANNAVYDIASTAVSSVWNVSGINNNGGYGDMYYFNSVSLTGQMNVSGTGPSAAFSNGNNSIGTAATNIDVRDNSFYINATAGGAATFYAHFTTLLAYTGSTLNNNDLFSAAAGSATAQLGFFNSANAANLAAWQTATLLEAASISANPLYNSATNLQPQLGSPLLLAGVPAGGIGTDITGAVRSGTTPTIGAYEIAADAAAPLITYTPLSNTCATGSVTLTTTITDPSGVPTAGVGLPVLYWKINAGAYTPVTATFVSGSTYTFTFGSGVTTGDVVSYYIVAQDGAGTPNVGSFPSAGAAGFTINPPAAATPPTTPSSYTIQSSLAGGTYTVGVGGAYTTLTAAVNAYNTSCLGGAIVFSLTDATYSGSETFPITINNNSFASAVNTLTIKPASGVNPTISGSSTTATIKLNGADYVTIEGSNNGSTSKNLTVENTNTGTSSAVIWNGSNGADGATNNTIKNTVVKGNAPLTTFVGILSGDGTTIGSTATAANTNFVVQGDSVIKSQYGIAVAGFAGQTGNVITQNKVGSNTATDYIGFRGIFVSNNTGAQVTKDTIFNIITTATNPTGIVISGGVLNSTFDKNTIKNVQYTGTSGYGGKGFDVFTGSATSNVTISNNMIADLRGDGWSSLTGDGIVGVRIGATGGSTVVTGGINLYYNSVSLGGGSFAGSTSGTLSAAMYFSSTASAIDLRNNIFYTNLVNTAAGAAKTYAIYSDAANTAFTTIDNNDYFVSGAQGVLGFLASDLTNLAGIQSGFGGNTSSQNGQPTFTSLTDLHLVSPDANNFTYLESKAAVISVTTDIDSQTRPNNGVSNLPDIGADEFIGAVPPCGDVTGLAASAITTTTATISWSVTPGATGYQYAVTTSPTPPGSGTATALISVPVSGLSSATVYYAYVRSDCGGGNFGNWATITFTTACANFTLPLNEGFNTANASTFPVCWSRQYVSGTSNLTFQTTSGNPTTLPAEGTRYVFWNSYSISAGDETRLVSPAITTTGTSSVDVEFKWNNDNNSSYNAGAYLLEGVQVQYSLDSLTWIDAGAFVPRHDGTLSPGSNQWNTISVTLPAGAGNQSTIFVGFKFHSEFGDNCSMDAVVVQATPTCIAPTALKMISASATTASLSWTAAVPAPSNGYQWKIVLSGAGSGGSAVASGTTGAGVTTATATGLTTGVMYDLFVRSDCGGSSFSSYAGPKTYTLNDDAAGAITLSVNAGCTGAIYTNVNATASLNEQWPNCSNVIVAPVWFRFVAPASGAVRVSTDVGSGNTFSDSKMGLFSVVDPTNYTSGFNILSCDDEGGATLGAEFGYMSVLYATGLTPGSSYWVAVDKYGSGNTSGTFCIAVDELSSTMLATTHACGDSYKTPFGSNNYTGWVPLMDANSKLVALIKNSDGGVVEDYNVSQNINTATVRTDAVSGQRYLDRNFHLDSAGVSAVNSMQVQLFFLNSELTTLQTVDPAVTAANLGVTRQTGSSCVSDFVAANGTNSYIPQVTNGSVNGARWLSFTSPGFSNFFLHTSKAPVTTKTFLQGAYASAGSHKNVSAPWLTVLQANATSQPYGPIYSYTGTESVSPTIFTATASGTDILDWVLLELRDAAAPATIIKQRAAFIRVDGKIVDLDGVSSVSFRGVATTNYFVVVRHRNHLSIRSSIVQAVDGTLGSNPAPSVYDFSTGQAKAFQDGAITTNAAMKDFGSGVFGMWGGNVNSNTNVRFTGLNNDPGVILAALGSNQALVLGSQYNRADVNMDGTVRFTGLNNDPGVILGVLGSNQAAIFTQHQ